MAGHDLAAFGDEHGRFEFEPRDADATDTACSRVPRPAKQAQLARSLTEPLAGLRLS
jgi:hypothetical protein